jgi:hypothetical protein
MNADGEKEEASDWAGEVGVEENVGACVAGGDVD